jgi:predicted 3-demethylubiquinone-9 3-methyltransferase (glyoxalase superfamily)
MSTITTFLWFDNQAEEAATFYTSLIRNSRVKDVSRGPAGDAMGVSFELDGQRFIAFNGGPHHKLNEAASIYVDCENQEEVDELWTRLTADGGEESRCGWLKDRFGLSWQIIPKILPALLSDPDPERATRAVNAMLTMQKIDIKSLVDAANQA